MAKKTETPATEAPKKLQLIISVDQGGNVDLQVPQILPLAYLLGLLEIAKDTLLNGEDNASDNLQ